MSLQTSTLFTQIIKSLFYAYDYSVKYKGGSHDAKRIRDPFNLFEYKGLDDFNFSKRDSRAFDNRFVRGIKAGYFVANGVGYTMVKVYRNNPFGIEKRGQSAMYIFKTILPLNKLFYQEPLYDDKLFGYFDISVIPSMRKYVRRNVAAGEVAKIFLQALLSGNYSEAV